MSAVDNEEESPQDLMSEIQKLRDDMLEIGQKMSSDSVKLRSEIFDELNKISEENKKIGEQNQTENQKKLQSIEDLVSKNRINPMMETKDESTSIDLSINFPLDNPTAKFEGTGKSFVLKHVFKNFEKFKPGEFNLSELVEHFGVDWCINLIHKDASLAFYLRAERHGDGWEIETEYDLKLIGPKKTRMEKSRTYCYNKNVGFGYHNFLGWEEVKKNYLVDGALTAEIHVKILDTKGLRKQNFRSFDESVKEVSDIVLVVKDRKFHVSKMFLAAQSSFFKALLLGNFAESKKSEVTLTGIDPEDFQSFLEVLYGEPAVDESNVEGIALLADMYDVPTAIRRCEEFLLEKSKKRLRKKIQMADRYYLDALKKKSLSEIKTITDIKTVMPNIFHDLEHNTIAALLEKAISFNA